MTTGQRTIPYEPEIRLILQAAMVLFIYTVVIGILNGLDLVTFERKPLLAHLHVGTLGWITMAVFAGSLWLFGVAGEENNETRWLARSAPLVALLYNIAFFTTEGIARPAMGALMMLVIVAFFVWGATRARVTEMSVPHLGLLVGLATSVVGALLGVLNALRIAQTDSSISETLGDAHPAVMVVGFLVPVGMAMIEWTLRPESIDERATRLGQFQIGLPSLGAVALTLGILADVEPLIMLSLPLQVAGLVIFLIRTLPTSRNISWLDAGLARYGATATIMLVVNIGILVYAISQYIEDFEAAPRRLFLALDHSIFVGVLTNVILAMIALTLRTQRAPWVDHVVFWGVNVGIAGMIVGLLADQTHMIRTFTPLLGFAILLAIAVHLLDVVKGGGASADPTEV